MNNQPQWLMGRTTNFPKTKDRRINHRTAGKKCS